MGRATAVALRLSEIDVPKAFVHRFSNPGLAKRLGAVRGDSPDSTFQAEGAGIFCQLPNCLTNPFFVCRLRSHIDPVTR